MSQKNTQKRPFQHMQVRSSKITAAFGSKLAEHLPLCYHSPHPHRQFSSQPYIASVWARIWTPKKCKIFTFHKTIYRSFNIHINYFLLFVLKEGCFTKLFPLVGRCRPNGSEVMAAQSWVVYQKNHPSHVFLKNHSKKQFFLHVIPGISPRHFTLTGPQVLGPYSNSIQ